MKKPGIGSMDREKEIRERIHLTRPPRLEGKVKNAMTNPKRKRPASELRKGPREESSGWE